MKRWVIGRITITEGVKSARETLFILLKKLTDKELNFRGLLINDQCGGYDYTVFDIYEIE